MADVRTLGFQIDGTILPSGEDLHIYPGISEDRKPEFFLISVVHDNAGNLDAELIPRATIISEPVSFHEIPGSDARQRINNWSLHLGDWLIDTLSHDLTVQAFKVPGEDLEVSDHSVIYAHLALRNGVTREDPQFWSDLILTYETGDVFADTVMPVPPFGLVSPEVFYLREYALREYSLI